jgi:hypothetical protein
MNYGGYQNQTLMSSPAPPPPPPPFGEQSSFDADDNKYKKTARGHRSRGGTVNWITHQLKQPLAWWSIAALLGALVSFRSQSQQNAFLRAAGAGSFQQVLDRIARHGIDRDEMQRELRTMKDSYRKAVENANAKDKENRRLQNELDGAHKAHKGAVSSEQKRVQTREQAWKQQVDLLQAATKRESKRAVIDKCVLCCGCNILLFEKLFLCEGHIVSRNSDATLTHIQSIVFFFSCISWQYDVDSATDRTTSKLQSNCPECGTKWPPDPS